MPFKCSLCELDIQVGEPMLSDDKMNLAHEACVKKARAVQVPAVIAVKTKVSGPGIGHPGAIVEPCLLPKAPSVCAECKKPAISMCPACHEYVHQDYGYNGSNCSGRHEGRCAGARESRAIAKKGSAVSEQVKAVVENMVPLGAGAFLTPKNGTAKSKPKGKGRR